ncbi:hypothetical protein RchiOBHm_Chr5g0024491 [Rosa chinensis]|uniref:25S rRNA (uridine-N(3))-methyltransferase BMT5-like domain-containing protein n=1 Tax=Rosa chinensis TaxID=74649 RepID=A0A2P6Q8D4_ROSCH|nr:hypothetical protein RchiOBHm_Chr5g0024491 [Rosa chinensis]
MAQEKRIVHYSSSQKILLVGEGDFSFAACLATAFDSAANIVATSLNSRGNINIDQYTSIFKYVICSLVI